MQAEAGMAPPDIFSECIEPALADISDKFSRLETFLPEMMESTEAMKGVQTVLHSPSGHLGQENKEVKWRYSQKVAAQTGSCVKPYRSNIGG
jgi:methanogenic corrinoid protein MtbC1